uniref:Kinesin motor domain-containing protein n=1 Tax=Periophthalmus magnuspinnatus TaxID=409849 RepID=A0A3B3ZK67_9GOBI
SVQVADLSPEKLHSSPFKLILLCYFAPWIRSDHKFYFDYVFGEDCSNEEVYQRTASPLVQHMLRGATCFAYGQTGAGKTHTMLGSSSAGCRGLYALAAQDLFSYLSSSPTLSVFVSFFEIYCGQLYDLLDHRKRWGYAINHIYNQDFN